MANIKPARYSKQSKSDAKSVQIIEELLDEEQVISHINSHDKIPNHDGVLELIDSEGTPIGELKVQVKTLSTQKKNTLSHPLEFRLFKYVVDVVQKPFILIVVDQTNRKAYWKHLSRELAEGYLQDKSRKYPNQKTISIHLDSSQEISSNEPYTKWISIIKKNIQKISGASPSKIVKVDVDDSKPYLSQFYEFVSKLFAELNFIPLHILASANPIFQSGVNRYDFYGTFEFTTNDKIFNLLSSFTSLNKYNLSKVSDTQAKQVKVFQKQLQFIVDRFVGNLIYNISKGRDKINILGLHQETWVCHCAECLWSRLENESLKDQLNYVGIDLNDMVATAYANYKIGNYIQSAKLFLKARDIAKKEKKWLTKFIIQYNLRKLYILIINGFLEDSDSDLFKQLEGIDLDKEYRNYADDQFFPVVDFIYQEKYLNQALIKIRNTNKEIIRLCKSSVYGGYSSNNYVWLIISKMAEIVGFIQANFIVYDAFKDFYELTEEFLEGVLASHATKPIGYARLEVFDNWLVNTIIMYCEPKQVLSLLKRYDLQKIEYKASGDEGKQATDFIIKLIERFGDAKKIAKKHFAKDNRAFLNNQTRMIRVAVLMAAKCTFKPEIVAKIASVLVTYLKSFGSSKDIEYVKFFFHHQSGNIKIGTWKKLFLSVVENPELQQEYLLNSLAHTLIRDKQQYLGFTAKQFEKVIAWRTVKYLYSGKTDSPMLLAYFYTVIEDQLQKEQIAEVFKSYLDEHFDLEVFNLAITYDLLRLNTMYLTQALDLVTPQKRAGGFVQRYQGLQEEDERFHNLDDLLNICFKEGKDLSDNIFNSLRGINHYYDWLLDMDGFDYSLFKPRWITEYSTRFYFKKMYASKKLKENLESFLATKESYHETQIMKAYLNIYVRKSWDI